MKERSGRWSGQEIRWPDADQWDLTISMCSAVSPVAGSQTMQQGMFAQRTATRPLPYLFVSSFNCAAHILHSPGGGAFFSGGGGV